MRNWLTIEVVLVVLLVTSFTCVGMLAMWAATSPRHWFVRVAVVFVVLSPLLAVPAHEVFATFVIECTVVAVGATAYRKSYLGRRFSLSALLFMVAVVSISTVISLRLPRLNGTAWITIRLMEQQQVWRYSWAPGASSLLASRSLGSLVCSRALRLAPFYRCSIGSSRRSRTCRVGRRNP